MVDSILSSEWEDRGVTRWSSTHSSRKPDEYVPAGRDVDQFASAQGLKHWIDPVSEQDSDLWVVAEGGPASAGGG